MPKYKLYAGLGGSFGGAECQGIFDYDTEEEALEEAEAMAIDIYQSYEGMYGILGWDELAELYPEYSPDEIDDEYQSQLDMWIDYYVITL